MALTLLFLKFQLFGCFRKSLFRAEPYTFGMQLVFRSSHICKAILRLNMVVVNLWNTLVQQGFPFYITAFLSLTNCSNKPSNKCKGNILAPSLLATAGLGCVSINKPSAPVAIAAFAIVPIN